MAEPASFEELDQAIGQVLAAETNNFFELAKMLGLDPKQDFAGANLSKTDFSGGNLAEANLAETDLRGANLAETDLCGANLAHANLQGANLTNANLGVSPSSYIARIQEIYRLILANNREVASNLADDLARDIASASASALALALDFDLACAFELDLARANTRAGDLARVSTFAGAGDLIRASASDLFDDLTRARTRALNLDLASASASNRDRFHRLIYAIGSGANLSGAKLDEANVEGAMMTNCKGLLSSEITNLARRGAIF